MLTSRQLTNRILVDAQRLRKELLELRLLVPIWSATLDGVSKFHFLLRELFENTTPPRRKYLEKCSRKVGIGFACNYVWTTSVNQKTKGFLNSSCIPALPWLLTNTGTISSAHGPESTTGATSIGIIY
jgi:hypothetical protein